MAAHSTCTLLAHRLRRLVAGIALCRAVEIEIVCPRLSEPDRKGADELENIVIKQSQLSHKYVITASQ